MARRTSTNIQPAVMTITSSTPTVGAGATGSFYMDLSQVASLLNRRFYRQGLNWAVAGFKMITATGVSGLVTIKQLGNTWVISNSWEKAFRAWNKQQMESVEDSGAESAVARFRDFKIHADPEHVTAGFANNLLPFDGQLPIAQPYAVGEWESSLIVVPNSVDDGTGSIVEPREWKLHMCGTNFHSAVPLGSRGIIEGYADSRAYPQSPDPVSPAVDGTNNWLARMFDVGADISEILDNATDRNDNLPYPQVDYPGGETQAPTMQIHDIVGISGTSIGNMSRAKGGNFPCGLVRIDFQNTGDLAGNLALQIDLVPGNHRGYLAEPMTEM